MEEKILQELQLIKKELQDIRGILEPKEFNKEVSIKLDDVEIAKLLGRLNHFQERHPIDRLEL